MDRRLRMLGLSGLFVAGAAALLLFSPSVPPPIGPGTPAPSFGGAASLEGERVTLESLRGRVVFLNFWATWCKPCEDEMPAMQRLYERLRGDHFEMVAVSVDDDAQQVRDFRDRLKLDFVVLHDPGRKVSAAYQSYKFPETYLIDGDGTIVSRFVGPKDWDAEGYYKSVQRLVEEEGAR